ncbi:hypothetical protein [Salinibacter altiplanensis]|uniref:hypothetical protein n=1 Tax=Salinibacter altiplanensis TaxID=1803181 RepID=UPI000C9EDE8B|nr:hypothetical protein [Salinibacter altiplanensis]
MHNLHGPDRLFETRYGHVLQCACCSRIQITLREHTLLVDADELEALTDTIKHAWAKVRNEDGQDQWTLQAGTDAGPVSITLSEPSLYTLHILLQGAWSMYTLRERVWAVVGGADNHRARDVLHNHVPPTQSRWGRLDQSS